MPAPIDVGFGEVVRFDLAQQVIDPDPQHDRELIEGGSGQRIVSAVDRYNKGQVKEPVVETTTSSASGPNRGSSQ
jgi:hypothetical protein